MTQDLSFDQQVFLLNLYSNSAGGKRGSVKELATLARKAIESQISQHLDGWQLAWGPSIYMHKKSHIADHLMYAAIRDATAGSPSANRHRDRRIKRPQDFLQLAYQQLDGLRPRSLEMGRRTAGGQVV